MTRQTHFMVGPGRGPTKKATKIASRQISVDVLGALVGVLGVLVGILLFWLVQLMFFGIGMVFLLNFVFVTCVYLVFSPPKNS